MFFIHFIQISSQCFLWICKGKACIYKYVWSRQKLESLKSQLIRLTIYLLLYKQPKLKEIIQQGVRIKITK